MPEFTYTARNSAGKDVSGSMSATSKREVFSLLGDRGLHPVRVDEARPPLRLWPKSKRIKAELLANNLTQLADLLQNGVSLMAALDVLVEQSSNEVVTEVMQDVRNKVAEGLPFDEALARHPEVFGELAISMVRAGSEGAFLEDALKRTADFLEMQEEMKGQVVGAMAYPAFLGAAGTVVTVVLIVFFVPKFAELFAQLEKAGGLPGPTVALLWISDFLGNYGLFIAAGLGGLVFWLRKRLKTDAARLFVDRYKIKLPAIGPIFLSTALSRFCRVLGTLLQNGVPLLRALEISSGATGNRVLAAAISGSAQNISSGQTLSRPLEECGLFPRPIMAMIAIAEESNNLEKVLINIADGIDRKIGRQLNIMVRLLEPSMLLILGAVVLFVLTALLLPVFEMSSTMS
ncbi:type II secretion system F family protein [Schlesneria paludicola]|uniref:type II secretion system F family protein n=1 Tax=Schlesneria paludicola TaxID=360056 RepID=UPI000492C19A|nr:type II secretion system F family protein [Schlesneria paludicola]